MTDFIHSLILPTAICTFDGEFVEVNNSLLSECKASTKSQLFNYRTTELFVDGSNYGRLVDTLIDGKTILNQEVLLYFFDNKIDMVISSMSLLSLESKLVIIQNQPVKLTRYLSQERFDILLKEMQKLKIGRDIS